MVVLLCYNEYFMILASPSWNVSTVLCEHRGNIFLKVMVKGTFASSSKTRNIIVHSDHTGGNLIIEYNVHHKQTILNILSKLAHTKYIIVALY